MKDLEQTFKGLADVTRLRIINLLLHGELCVCSVQYALGASQPNVSRHLIYLRNSGLVLDRREGARIFYRLAQPADGTRRQLFSFLQTAFAEDSTFSDDCRRLQQAIENGLSNGSQWRPYSALIRPPGAVKHHA